MTGRSTVGVVLAGGTGRRLRPLTSHVNKHLLLVGGRAMVSYPVSLLAGCGVSGIVIVTGQADAADLRAWAAGPGSTAAAGTPVRVVEQGAAAGVADALVCARDGVMEAGGIAGDREPSDVAVVLGDNLFGDGFVRTFADAIGSFRGGAGLFLRWVADGSRYGVARFDGPRLVGVEEKPAEWGPAMAVTGAYLYSADVFDLCRGLRPSARGELEISDVNDAYVRAGRATWRRVEDWWIDAGTFESLAEAERRVGRSG